MNTVHTTPDTTGGQPDLLDLLAGCAAEQHGDVPPGGTPGADRTAERYAEDADLSPAERFERFHEDNPAVYAAMVALCRQWVARTGRRKLGINSLIERVRWEIAMRTNDPDFKINNNHAPFYSRLIMRQEPDLADLFELRRSTADEWIGGQAA